METLPKEQHLCCSKKLAQEKEDKVKRERERDLVCPNQAFSDDNSYGKPTYNKPYNRNSYSKPKRESFAEDIKILSKYFH